MLQPKINCETKAGQDHPEYEKFCEAYNLSHGNGTAGTIHFMYSIVATVILSLVLDNRFLDNVNFAKMNKKNALAITPCT